jgi:hypothetical protein
MNINQHTTDKTGCTPLTFACYSGNLEAVKLLLDQGADRNLATLDGYTPLHVASQKGNVEIMRLLMGLEDLSVDDDDDDDDSEADDFGDIYMKDAKEARNITTDGADVEESHLSVLPDKTTLHVMTSPSKSRPGVTYITRFDEETDEVSCTCPGFEHRTWCCHCDAIVEKHRDS